jgi:hypothetical protein
MHSTRNGIIPSRPECHREAIIFGRRLTAHATASTILGGTAANIHTFANAQATGDGNDLSLALVSAAATGLANQFVFYDSYAVGTGVTIFLNNNVSTVFGAAGAKVFGSAALGGNYDAAATGAQTYSSALEWVYNAASVQAGTPIDLGFVDTTTVGTGFGGIKLTATLNGAPALAITAATLTEANAALTDTIGKVGVWDKQGKEIDLKVSLEVTLTAPNSGFGVDLVAGLGAKAAGPDVAPPAVRVPVTAATASGAPPEDGWVPESLSGASAASHAAAEGTTVQLDAATHLLLNARPDFIGIGRAGNDTTVAGGSIDHTDLGYSLASYGYDCKAGTPHVQGGPTAADIVVGGGLLASAFHLAGDGSGDTLPQYGHV